MVVRRAAAPALNANGHNIHLKCIVCKDQPEFSDMSHLLTHLGSKGHLSKKFQTMTMAKSDPRLRLLNDQFDYWYAQNGLDDLMKERMDQKEKKRSTITLARARGSTASTSRRSSAAPSNRSRNAASASHTSSRRPQTLRESTLDPQLGPYIKTENFSRSTTPNFPYGSSTDAGAMARSYAPPMGAGPGNPYSMGSPMRMPSVLDSINTPSTDDSTYGESPPHKASCGRKRHLSESTISVVEPEDMTDGTSGALQLSPIPLTLKDPNSKIASVLYFDSANSEQRRNRNQKKPSNVILKMIRNSGRSRPDEYVYKDGEERTVREITGMPNSEGDRISGESSPVLEDLPPPPPRRGGRRPKTSQTKRNSTTSRPRTARRDSRQASITNGGTPYPVYDCSSDGNEDMKYDPLSSAFDGVRGYPQDHNDSRFNSPCTSMFDMSAPQSHRSQMPVLNSAFPSFAQPSSFIQRGQQTNFSYTYGASQSFPSGPGTMLPASMHLQGSMNNFASTMPSGFQPTNFGSFGRLTNVPIGGNFGIGNPLFGHGVSGVASNVQQQFDSAGSTANCALNGFHSQDMSGVADLGAFDPFNIDAIPKDESGEGSLPEQFNADAVSGLLFGSNYDPPEDDGATVSAQNSEV